MKIIDDKISLDPSDIAQFSPAAQKALAFPESGNVLTGGRTYQQVAETAFNQALANALEIWRRTITAESALTKLAEAVAVEVDPTKKAQAEALIDQAKEVLDVKTDETPAASLNPSAGQPVPK